MKNILLCLLCLSANAVFAQADDDDYKPVLADTTYVIASTGLDLYEKPQKTAKILFKIPCGTAVKPLEIDDRDEYMLEKLQKSRISIDNINGFWLKIKYKNTVGYGFTAFLHTTKPDSLATSCALFLPNEDYNEVSYKNMADFNWYGIYKKDKLRFATKKIESLAFFKMNAVWKYERQYYATTRLAIKNGAATTDSLYFIIGLRKKNNTEIASGMLPESVYMGGLYNEKNSTLDDKTDSPDQIQIGFTDWRLKLDKTFTRIAPKKEGEKPTAELADWKLLLVRNDFREKQVLIANDSLFSPPFKLSCYGDFDEDGKLDFMVSNNAKLQLFLSSAAPKNALVKCVATLVPQGLSGSIILMR
jgi:hypothetical protein